jgi:hypothetical protein
MAANLLILLDHGNHNRGGTAVAVRRPVAVVSVSSLVEIEMLKKCVAMLAGATALALVAGPASALVAVQYSIGGGGFTTCTDGQACDLNPGGDAVLLAIFGFGAIHITQGSTSQGGSEAESIHLTVQDNAVPGPVSNTVRILVSGTDFTTRNSPQTFVSRSSATALANAVVDYHSWADDANALFGQTCAIETGTTLSAVGFASTPGSCATDGLYSLTQEMVINFNIAAGRQGAVNLVMSTEAAIVEPLTTGLLAAGLLGFAGLRLRRKA